MSTVIKYWQGRRPDGEKEVHSPTEQVLTAGMLALTIGKQLASPSNTVLQDTCNLARLSVLHAADPGALVTQFVEAPAGSGMDNL